MLEQILITLAGGIIGFLIPELVLVIGQGKVKIPGMMNIYMAVALAIIFFYKM